MKRIITLLFVIGVVSIASANNEVPENGGDKKTEQNPTRRNSLSQSFFSFFDIFLIDPVESDSTEVNTIIDKRIFPAIENEPQ